MKAPQHLPLEHLIPLAAQVAAAIHLGMEDLQSQDHGIRQEVKLKAYNLNRRNGDLAKLFGVLAQEIDQAARNVTLTKGFSQSIKSLKMNLSERSCEKCTDKDSRCKRDKPTNEKVHEVGNCIAPIKDVYKEICADVEVLWLSAIPPHAPIPSLQLGTRLLAFQDRLALFQDFDVTGKATIVDGDEPTTTITLAVYNRPFDLGQFLLLPYLLFHEIVCHGYQDVFDPSGGPVHSKQRYAADANCFWSEGWMDTAAHYRARAWLEVVVRQRRHSISSARRGRFALKWTDEFHDARYGFEGEILSQERHQGRTAFENVKDSLIACGMAEGAALDLMLRFSILLNGVIIGGLPMGAKPNAERRAIACLLETVAVSKHAPKGRAVMEQFLLTRSVAELHTKLREVSI